MVIGQLTGLGTGSDDGILLGLGIMEDVAETLVVTIGAILVSVAVDDGTAQLADILTDGVIALAVGLVSDKLVEYVELGLTSELTEQLAVWVIQTLAELLLGKLADGLLEDILVVVGDWLTDWLNMMLGWGGELWDWLTDWSSDGETEAEHEIKRDTPNVAVPVGIEDAMGVLVDEGVTDAVPVLVDEGATDAVPVLVDEGVTDADAVEVPVLVDEGLGVQDLDAASVLEEVAENLDEQDLLGEAGIVSSSSHPQEDEFAPSSSSCIPQVALTWGRIKRAIRKKARRDRDM